MPALPPGITKIELPGRKGRNGKRTPGTRYEAKAYNRQSKRTEYVGRLATREDAIAAKRAFEEMHGTAKGSRSQLTVRTFVEAQYLTRTTTIGRNPRPIKASTISTNRHAVVPFVEAFGSERLDRLDEDAVVAWCESQPGYVVEGLRAMFAWALRRRLLKDSPLRFVDSRRTDGRKALPVVSTDDLENLIAAAGQCWPGVMGLRLAVLLVLLAYTGMRPSEAFALRPEHIDLDGRRIDLDWQLDEHGKLQPLKNNRKRRIVMDPEVARWLPQLLDRTDGNELLFRTVQNAKLNCKSKWSYYWDPIRKCAGLGGMDVYELRHYCATILLDNDARPEDVALQFGHSDGGDLVRKLYGHPDAEVQRERLDRVMRGRTKTIRRRATPTPPSDTDGEAKG